MKVDIVIADYHNTRHAQDLLLLLSAYALDPMGGGEPLTDHVKATLLSQIRQQNNVFTILCYVDDLAAGLINCVEGFSTFSAKPLVNIHDVVVLAPFRGKGLSKKMLEQVEKMAIEKGCCKLTLEVLEGNKIAQAAYQQSGFLGYELDPKLGKAVFWQKKLS